MNEALLRLFLRTDESQDGEPKDSPRLVSQWVDPTEKPTEHSVQWHDQYPNDWLKVWHLVQEKWGEVDHSHQGSKTAAEFQKILDHRGIAWNSPIGALAHLQLGRAYTMAGEIAKPEARRLPSQKSKFIFTELL